jgi:hypothetical protein
VRVRYAWFTTSSKVEDDVLAEMLHQTPQSVREAISAQKRLLKSRHPALVAAKQAFQAVKDYADSLTIPLIALQAGGGDVRKDGGVRVIQKKDMAEFDERMRYLTGVLTTAVGQPPGWRCRRSSRRIASG